MNESILKALMRLFAIVADVPEDGLVHNARNIVVNYLKRQFSNELVNTYIDHFDRYIVHFHPSYSYNNQYEKSKQESYNEKQLIENCQQINNELEHSQKVTVLIYLIDFIYSDYALTEREIKLVSTIGDSLKIPLEDFTEIKAFTFGKIDEIKRKENLLFIDNDDKFRDDKIKHTFFGRMKGRITAMLIPQSNNIITFRYDGDDDFFLNGQHIDKHRSYIWALGSVIKNAHIGSLYYSKAINILLQSKVESKFIFEAHDVAYRYGTSSNGVKPFNINEYSGQLIGIIGGSGSGKSTLLNVLNGNLKPNTGTITINGYDIHKSKKELEGVIGYVPQDDMLIKELTVYENLYYNAKLSFKDATLEEINQIIDSALLNFDLIEARDLKVGSTTRTILSGGQRKRLNIALELLREPWVLFVDEPTSGLSSADTEKVMSLLKRQSIKGKLVFAILHQPSADIFRLIDKLIVMDQGGRVIYYGNPIEAIPYFKEAAHYADACESECLSCGNIDADSILRTVEARVVDVNGRLSRNRKTSPDEWYTRYLENIDKKIKNSKRPHNYSIPKSHYNVPNRWQQTRIYLKRDVLAKLSNNQYLLMILSTAPLLALLLGFFTKSFTNTHGKSIYLFSENTNIPAYLFMSVIVALFMGLMVSSEEIFKDRRLIQRESFINLSRSSYLNAKVAILFFISALQTLLFVLIGNNILEIKGLTFQYWVILFTASAWANLVGLNISSGFNSVVTIYIFIPLILVPQLLFSGVVVNFDDMHKNIKSEKFTPVVGDLMTSRWTYEAIMLTQFMDNEYEKIFYPAEKKINNALYNKAYLMPELKSIANKDLNNLQNQKNISSTINDLKILYNEIVKLQIKTGISFKALEKINIDDYNEITHEQVKTYFGEIDSYYTEKYRDALKEKEARLNDAVHLYGSQRAVIDLKNTYHNKQVANVVLNNNKFRDFRIGTSEIIPLKDPAYRDPDSPFGRAHYYAPTKKIGKLKIGTFYFNLIVIWLTTAILYLTLYYRVISEIMKYIEGLKIQRLNSRFRRILSQVTQ